MGSAPSQADYSRFSLGLYQGALQSPCLLPNVGIDESLLKFSGVDSNSMLYNYSNELAVKHPDYKSALAASLRSTRSIPNAVGMGAFVLSIIMDLSISPVPGQQPPNSNNMFQRVFGEEHASDVRDTMSEYIKRHQMFMNNDQRLLEEIRPLERQPGGHLTSLRNYLLFDGQMSSHRFKIWVNGAFFHIQMLLHEARVTKILASDFVDSIQVAVSLYLQDLDHLLAKYKAFKTGTTLSYDRPLLGQTCTLVDVETNCDGVITYDRSCDNPGTIQGYIDHVFSSYEPIAGSRKHMTGIQTNINNLIRLHDAFILP